MPLQNRVDPWGELTAVDARGSLTGNRGILHNDHRQIVRPRSSRAWITCALEFKGWHREVMTPGTWTELFFLDEATALAAGHRPCFECRRDAATRFMALHRRVSGQADAKAGDLDAQLASERRIPRTGLTDGKRAYRALLGSLPTGVIVELTGMAWLVLDGTLLRWSHDGYDPASRRPVRNDEVGWVLTPPTAVRILTAGYSPALHPSIS